MVGERERERERQTERETERGRGRGTHTHTHTHTHTPQRTTEQHHGSQYAQAHHQWKQTEIVLYLPPSPDILDALVLPVQSGRGLQTKKEYSKRAAKRQQKEKEGDNAKERKNQKE